MASKYWQMSIRIPSDCIDNFKKIRQTLKDNDYFGESTSFEERVKEPDNKYNAATLRVLINSFFRRDFYRIEMKIDELKKVLNTMLQIFMKQQNFILMSYTQTCKITEFKDELDTIIMQQKEILNILEALSKTEIHKIEVVKDDKKYTKQEE